MSTVPIIIMTSRRSDEEKVKGLRLGADDYVVKPFNPQELVARVSSVLRRTRLPPPSQEHRDALQRRRSDHRSRPTWRSSSTVSRWS